MSVAVDRRLANHTGIVGAIVVVLLALALGSCSSTPPQTEKPIPVAPPAARGRLPELSQGTCGGFGDLAIGKNVPMLSDRVRVGGLEGATESNREQRIASLLSASSHDSLALGLAGEELRISASEAHRRPGRDLFAAVQAKAEGAAVVSVPGSGGEVVVKFPRPPEPRTSGEEEHGHGRGPLLEAYLGTADGLVVVLHFFASEGALKAGGCERVALRLAGTARTGARALAIPVGERQLVGGVAAQIPPDHVITTHDMSHWLEIHVHPIVDMDQPEPYMTIRFDRHPGRRELDGIPWSTVTAPAYGEPADWREWKDKKGRRWRDVIVAKGPEGKVLFAIGANDDAMLDALTKIAGSVGDRTAKNPALRACTAVVRPSAAAATNVDEHLTTLLKAGQFALDSDVYGAPRAPELDAFRALAMRPDGERASAFRHLAENGTPAGRLYGLAGLYYADPAAFEPVSCAVRDRLTGTVDVALRCGITARPAAQLLESSDPSAIRGEPFVGGAQWSGAGARDLRGGALAHALWGAAMNGGESDVARDGYVPPVVAGAPPTSPLTNGTKPASRIAHTGNGLCWTRDDGRLVCAGEIFGGRKADSRLILAPDMVRYPADLALGNEHTLCVLDVKGRRACTGSIMSDLEIRDLRCGVPTPRQMVYRVFDDGPWERLVTLGDVCGIRGSDGALFCFRARTNESTSADKEPSTQQGHYRAYRIPVEGRVVGVGTGKDLEGNRAHYAFTEDGALWEWISGRDPKVAGRFEAPIERLAHIAQSDFITLRGGRVFARGIAGDGDPFGSGDRAKHAKWIEVNSLRDAQIHAHPDQHARGDQRGCTLDPKGQVGCWQQCEERPDSDEACKGLDGLARNRCADKISDRETCKPTGRQTIGAFRGSSELFMEAFYGCARQSATRLSCTGPGVEWIVGKNPGKGSVQLDLAKLAGSAVEYTLPERTPMSPARLEHLRSQSSLGY